MFRGLYDLLDETPPAYAEAVQTLWAWSLNCSHPTPAAIFADMIGVSEEWLGDGETLSRGDFSGLGYLELDYLADALKEYAARPDQVRHYVRDLLDAEQN